MFKIKLMAGALGAEIHGIDLRQAITPAIAKEIRRLWLEHQVIFFRNQNIEPAQHKALAQIFGPLQTHPAYRTVEGFPEITILEATADKPYKIDTWHTDMTFRKNPPLGSVLRSRIIPEKGGDTLFASLSAAYNALSEKMKQYFTCRFNWEVNSIAIWDNRATQHKPINDFYPAHRLLERIVIDGDKP